MEVPKFVKINLGYTLFHTTKDNELMKKKWVDFVKLSSISMKILNEFA
jgi:hypothetical protein